MGIFSTTSPFDADVEKATNENNTSEEWGLIMEICDKVGNSSSNAKECLRSILRRLQNPDPHIVLQAITLLDACVSNCGKTFQLEIASRDFETELRKLLSKWTGANQSKVAERLKQLIKKWAEGEFKSDPQLSLIPSLYTKLRLEGIDFSTPPDSATRMNRQAPADPDAVSSQQEVEDIAKAIELSLKETHSPKQQQYSYSSTTSSTASLYPSVSGALSTPSGSTSGSGVVEPRKVRALYDFEAAEDNELTFIAGEIVHVLDDSDANWWKGRNQRGEGLFPANFVTSDLTVNVEKPKTEKKGVQFNEAVEVKTIKVAQQVEIDEGKIDRLLHLLHEADPNDGQEDSDELLVLEEEVNSMGPLIDTELERVDRKHAQLTQVSSGLVEALNLYHTLMREPPPHGGPPPQFHKPPPPVYGPPPPHPHQMYNGVGPIVMPGGGVIMGPPMDPHHPHFAAAMLGMHPVPGPGFPPPQQQPPPQSQHQPPPPQQPQPHLPPHHHHQPPPPTASGIRPDDPTSHFNGIYGGGVIVGAPQVTQLPPPPHQYPHHHHQAPPPPHQ